MGTERIAAALVRADPEEMARLVGGLDDAELDGALRSGRRREILDKAFRHFPEYVDPERTAAVGAAIGWHIDRERFTVLLERGTCRAGRELPADPRVMLELGAVDFLRLVTGTASAAVLFVTGRIGIAGDETFARELAGFFRVPGGEGARPEVEPGSVDALELAAAISRSPDGRLRRGMRSAFRATILDEVFRRFPDYLDAERTRGVRAAIEWRITGGPAADDRFGVEIEDGACRAARDLVVDPRVGLKLDGADFLKLVTGNANPAALLLRRRIHVRGDLAFAARLAGLFRIPAAGA